MTQEDLIKLKKKLSKLDDLENKKRDLYLRKIANGEIYGPLVGYASIDKSWLKYYTKDELETEIPAKTAYRLIYDNNQNNLNQIAFDFLDKQITYFDFFKHVDNVSKGLKYQGVQEGDIVTICMPNMPETVYLFYALNKIGAIADFLDPRATANVMEQHLKLAESKILFTIDDCYPLFEIIKNNTVIESIVNINILNSLTNYTESINDSISWTDFITSGKNISRCDEALYKEDKLATILHTGGTTGIPKGALLTDLNLNSLVIQWNKSGLKYDDGSSLLSLMPPFVSFGLAANLHMPLYNKMKLILIPDYAPEKIVEQIEKYHPNYVPASPAHWENIYNYLKNNHMDFSTLTMGMMGGDILSNKIKNKLNNSFVNGNMKIAYGLTESATALTLPFDEKMASGENVGIPLIKTVVSIFDSDDLTEKGYNQVGEICALTPNMMKEYYGMKDETEKVLKVHDDGKTWLHTGDMGYMNEDGVLTVKGRIKKMIIRFDGIKVYSIDIEKVLNECSVVDQCAVVGVKDSNHIQGEVPVAYIVLSDNIELSNDIYSYIFKYCQDNIIDYANPVDFVFVNKLPYTKNGKIDFKFLKNNYESQNNNKNGKKLILE